MYVCSLKFSSRKQYRDPFGIAVVVVVATSTVYIWIGKMYLIIWAHCIIFLRNFRFIYYSRRCVKDCMRLNCVWYVHMYILFANICFCCRHYTQYIRVCKHKYLVKILNFLRKIWTLKCKSLCMYAKRRSRCVAYAPHAVEIKFILTYGFEFRWERHEFAINFILFIFKYCNIWILCILIFNLFSIWLLSWVLSDMVYSILIYSIFI